MRKFRAKTLKIVEGYYRNRRGFEGFAAGIFGFQPTSVYSGL
jgi:hypothetical protein